MNVQTVQSESVTQNANLAQTQSKSRSRKATRPSELVQAQLGTKIENNIELDTTNVRPTDSVRQEANLA